MSNKEKEIRKKKKEEKSSWMTNKEKEIEKILEIIDTELSKKEQAYLLGVIEGLKIARTI